MWLIVALIAALAATAAYALLKERKKYKLGFLSLMLWGMFLMVLVDRSIAYFEGGQFIEATTDGLVASSALLGIAMLLPVLLIWAIAAFTQLGARICIG